MSYLIRFFIQGSLFLLIHGLNTSVNNVYIKQISNSFIIPTVMWWPFLLLIYHPTWINRWMWTAYVKMCNIRKTKQKARITSKHFLYLKLSNKTRYCKLVHIRGRNYSWFCGSTKIRLRVHCSKSPAKLKCSLCPNELS